MQCSALKAVHRRNCYTYQKYQNPKQSHSSNLLSCEAAASIMRATVFSVVKGIRSWFRYKQNFVISLAFR